MCDHPLSFLNFLLQELSRQLHPRLRHLLPRTPPPSLILPRRTRPHLLLFPLLPLRHNIPLLRQESG